MTDTTEGSAPAASRGGCAPVVFEVSDHVVAYYVGRGLTGASPLAGVEGNWVDVEWELGEANYAIHAGDHAVVYDTMPLPELARWMREHLERELGIRRFTIVLSHWHLDHVAGNACFRDSPIVARDLTRQALAEQREAIAAGTLWGPPGIEVVLPTITFERRLDLFVGDLQLELHGFDIHSRDANLLFLPDEGVLFAGDALEDSISYVVEPEGLATHVAELERLKGLGASRIYPQHGDPEVIAAGGYPPAFVDAAIEYAASLLRDVRDGGAPEAPVEAFIPEALAAGHGPIWPAYRRIHEQNLRVTREHYLGAPGPPS